MNLLQLYVKEILKEDLEGFVKDVSDVRYVAGSTAAGTVDKKIENKSKDVKRRWAKNADHTFMNSINKVHWFGGNTPYEKFSWFLDNSGKDEVSTSGYLPGEKMKSLWGDIGVLLTGRVTLAANSMDTITSGYASDFQPDSLQKYASSGVPRRAGVFNVGKGWANSDDYVLDSNSFHPSNTSENEFIVDNWHVKALVVKGSAFRDKSGQATIKLAKQKGIPVMDLMGNILTLT